MKILVSACLLGENCKYSGGNNLCEKVLEYIKGHDVISVCPEVMGGLPTPRVPAEIVNGIVTNKENIIVDSQFRKGSELCTQIALENKVDLAILKANSPSCGFGQIYDGTFTSTKIKGNGIFAQQLSEQGIKIITELDI